MCTMTIDATSVRYTRSVSPESADERTTDYPKFATEQHVFVSMHMLKYWYDLYGIRLSVSSCSSFLLEVCPQQRCTVQLLPTAHSTSKFQFSLVVARSQLSPHKTRHTHGGSPTAPRPASLYRIDTRDIHSAN